MDFVVRDGRYSLRIGRFSFAESAFMMTAAAVIGAGGGLGAVIFRAMISGAQSFAFGIVGHTLHAGVGSSGVVVQLAVGGAIAAFVTTRFAPEAKGHGVPEVMEAVALRGGKMRPRVIAIKSLASATTIGFGGSVGREGPIVQIGSAIGSVLGQLVRAPSSLVRTLVACGAAAGISATFNAPIGGVFFSAEIILGEFEPRSFAAIVVASVVAAVEGRAFLGNHPSFDASAFLLVSPWELFFYAFLGLIAAAWATGFVKLLYATEDGFDRVRGPAWAKGAAGFAGVGLIGVWFPQIFGVGYDPIQQVLHEHVPALHALTLAALKPFATSLTLGAGGSGGVFAPSLFIGAFLGDWFGSVVHGLFPLSTGSPAAYGLVGMAAVFAAAAEAPITAIMIVFEMSNNYTIILPLMVTVVIASLLGRRFLGSTVYERKLLRRGVDWQRVRRPRFFTKLSVSSVARAAPLVAQADQLVAELMLEGVGEYELAMPVCDGERFVGIVTATDVARAMLAGNSNASLRSIVRASPEHLKPTDTLERAATLMAEVQIPLLAVVSTEGGLVGIVTRRDLLNAYRTESRA